MYDGIETLPSPVHELHLSAARSWVANFRDLHHASCWTSRSESIVNLLPRCPNLLGVSYEDPMYRETGQLVGSPAQLTRGCGPGRRWQRGETA